MQLQQLEVEPEAGVLEKPPTHLPTQERVFGTQTENLHENISFMIK